MKNKKTPEIRFEGFTGAWEQRKVSEITLFHKQGFYTTEEYDDSKKYYLLRGTDLTENRVQLKGTPKINASEKEYKDFKVQNGDFLIVRSGTVGTYGIVNEDIEAIFGSYLINFRFNKNFVTNEFFGYFYQSDLYKTQLRQIIQQSANTNINAENIKSVTISLPKVDEQKRIGDFFADIDYLITLHQRELTTLKQTKQSFLQKMFPREGESVPEVRFPGFTGAWEQRKLGDVLSSMKSGLSRMLSNDDIGLPVIRANNINEGRLDLINDIKYWFVNDPQGANTSNYFIHKNDILVNFINSEAKMGTAAIVVTEPLRDTIYTTNILNLRTNNLADAYFIFLLTMTVKYKNYIKLITKPAVNQASFTTVDFKEFSFHAPTMQEQIKIGEFFKQLNNLITLHQRELDALKETKKAFLQKMFI